MPVPNNEAAPSNKPAQQMTCMEVWSGSQLTTRRVEMGGLDAWVYSKPFGEAQRGGDVYYASSCATGRITRLLLADVFGPGNTMRATEASHREGGSGAGAFIPPPAAPRAKPRACCSRIFPDTGTRSRPPPP